MVEALFVLLIYHYINRYKTCPASQNAAFPANYPTCVRKKYLRAHTSDLTTQTSHHTPHTLTTKPHHTSLCSPRTSYPNSLRPSQLAPHTSNIAPHTTQLTPHASSLTPENSQLADQTSHSTADLPEQCCRMLHPANKKIIFKIGAVKD